MRSSIATAKPNATGFMWNNLGTAYEQLDQLDDARVAFEAGGKLGSKEAVASRKRLEGVDPDDRGRSRAQVHRGRPRTRTPRIRTRHRRRARRAGRRRELGAERDLGDSKLGERLRLIAGPPDWA